ncbi:MAG: hypothetical protein K2I74_09440, partial [Treponemataceae bacterium]|nr:hypothetical protein [Treponemataceae bacterium]
KLSRIALLAAASAFMLAVFPACGDDDGNDDPKATLAAEAVELEIGAEKTVEATVTVENDTFSAEAKKIQPNGEIPITYFELKAGVNVTVSVAKVKTWDSDTKATITFTVTAAEGAAAGKISAEIKAGTLTSNATLTTTGNIAYTIKGAGNEQVGENIEPVIWKISDYHTMLGSSTTSKKVSELGFSSGVECGIAKLGENVKLRSDGAGVSNTVTDGVTGYCQLSNGKAGSLLLTVPAGTSKITLGAKNVNNALAIYDSTYGTALKEFKGSSSSDNYADFVYEYTFGEETQVYVTSVGGTTNFKALKLE